MCKIMGNIPGDTGTFQSGPSGSRGGGVALGLTVKDFTGYPPFHVLAEVWWELPRMPLPWPLQSLLNLSLFMSILLFLSVFTVFLTFDLSHLTLWICPSLCPSDSLSLKT